MTTHSGLLCAVALVFAPALRAQQSVVRSDDGRATLTLPAALTGTAVKVIHLPDGDDVAAVAGARYRVEGPASLPAGSTLSIRWDSAGLPGGITRRSVTLMRRSGEGWENTAATTDGSDVTTVQLRSSGEFSIRWDATQRCDGAAYHSLDFRLGTWGYRATGYTPGKSVFTRDATGCALFDHYVDQQGDRSTSLFRYDETSGLWYNTTIDPGGRSVTTGKAVGDTIKFYHSPTDREVYRKQGSDSVTFAGERSTDGGKTWKVWVTALYTRAHNN